jgi:hypothetical protein
LRGAGATLRKLPSLSGMRNVINNRYKAKDIDNKQMQIMLKSPIFEEGLQHLIKPLPGGL